LVYPERGRRVSTNYAVPLTSVHGSLQTTLRLALLQSVTPAHKGLAPSGTFYFKELYLPFEVHTIAISNGG